MASARATKTVRWAAVGLAFLDGCVREIQTPAARTSPTTTTTTTHERDVESPGFTDEFPAALARAPHDHFALQSSRAWPSVRYSLLEADAGRGQWELVEKQAQELSAMEWHRALVDVISAHARARGANQRERLADLVGMLNAIEGVPSYDGAFAAYLWRRARTATDDPSTNERALLFGRLHLHLCVVDALTQGIATLAPVEFTAWRSKAAPQGWTPTPKDPAKLVPAARAAFDARRSIPWDTVALDVRVVGDATTRASFVRGGHTTPLDAGARVKLARLDLLHADTALRLRTNDGTELAVPAGTVLTLDRLGDHLDAATKAEFTALIELAAGGDAAAEQRLEARVPLLHGLIRAWLREHPDHPGHPGSNALRMLLITFDE